MHHFTTLNWWCIVSLSATVIIELIVFIEYIHKSAPSLRLSVHIYQQAQLNWMEPLILVRETVAKGGARQSAAEPDQWGVCVKWDCRDLVRSSVMSSSRNQQALWDRRKNMSAAHPMPAIPPSDAVSPNGLNQWGIKGEWESRLTLQSWIRVKGEFEVIASVMSVRWKDELNG